MVVVLTVGALAFTTGGTSGYLLGRFHRRRLADRCHITSHVEIWRQAFEMGKRSFPAGQRSSRADLGTPSTD